MSDKNQEKQKRPKEDDKIKIKKEFINLPHKEIKEESSELEEDFHGEEGGEDLDLLIDDEQDSFDTQRLNEFLISSNQSIPSLDFSGGGQGIDLREIVAESSNASLKSSDAAGGFGGDVDYKASADYMSKTGDSKEGGGYTSGGGYSDAEKSKVGTMSEEERSMVGSAGLREGTSLAPHQEQFVPVQSQSIDSQENLNVNQGGMKDSDYVARAAEFDSAEKQTSQKRRKLI